MRVKIIKAKKHYWYYGSIGKEFVVVDDCNGSNNLIVKDEFKQRKYVGKDDCEIIRESGDRLPVEFQNLVKQVKELKAEVTESIGSIGDRLDALEQKKKPEPELFICENAEKCDVASEFNPSISGWCSGKTPHAKDANCDLPCDVISGSKCIPYVEEKKECCEKWRGAFVRRRVYGSPESEILKRCQECGGVL